jgi:hypothetical protein
MSNWPTALTAHAAPVPLQIRLQTELVNRLRSQLAEQAEREAAVSQQIEQIAMDRSECQCGARWSCTYELMDARRVVDAKQREQMRFSGWLMMQLDSGRVRLSARPCARRASAHNWRVGLASQIEIPDMIKVGGPVSDEAAVLVGKDEVDALNSDVLERAAENIQARARRAAPPASEAARGLTPRPAARFAAQLLKDYFQFQKRIEAVEWQNSSLALDLEEQRALTQARTRARALGCFG